MRTQNQLIRALQPGFFENRVQFNPGDVMIVVDMQNDFMSSKWSYVHEQKGSMKTMSPRLPTPYADSIIHCILSMMIKFFASGGLVVATKDFHPENHVSFSTFGRHCLIGHEGGELVEPIREFMETHYGERCMVFLKAFHPEIDSFGAFPYAESYARGRISGCGDDDECLVKYTGSYYDAKVEYPDSLGYTHSKDDFIARRENCIQEPYNCDFIDMDTMLSNERGVDKYRNALFVCGVLGDYCVVDTALNALEAGYQNVYIVFDLIRSLMENKEIVNGVNYWTDVRRKGVKFVLSDRINV